MKNIYQGTITHPFHLSVGAVLFNEEGKIACHYFKEYEYKPDNVFLEDFYILMRETLEIGENLEEAVRRGIKEEFGATGDVVNYLGTIKSQFVRGGNIYVEKTTLYFLLKLEDFNVNLRKKDDEEIMSLIQWHEPDFLIQKMKEQSNRYERTDLDESIIVKRAKKIISKNYE